MKPLAFINASPKPKNTVSGALLTDLARFLRPQPAPPVFRLPNAKPNPKTLTALAEYRAVVLAFPVYLDAPPAHLLAALNPLDSALLPGTPVYTLVNCGFYEGQQTAGCHRVIQNWCQKNGLCYAGGVGIGGGGSVWLLKRVPRFCWPRRGIDTALNALATAAKTGGPLPVVYTTVDYPRFFYLTGAELSWNKKGRRNGLSPADLKKPRTPC